MQGVGRREAAKVLCEVEANPSDNVRYTWRFNNSRETVNLDRDRYTEEGPRSTAAYTPLTPLDYGTLMCWASNEFGKQTVPCVYQVIAAGKCLSVYYINIIETSKIIILCQSKSSQIPLIFIETPIVIIYCIYRYLHCAYTYSKIKINYRRPRVIKLLFVHTLIIKSCDVF